MQLGGDAKTYLGDGVYALFDGYAIQLSIERKGQEQIIFLEPDIFKALLEFAGKYYDIKGNRYE